MAFTTTVTRVEEISMTDQQECDAVIAAFSTHRGSLVGRWPDNKLPPKLGDPVKVVPCFKNRVGGGAGQSYEDRVGILDMWPDDDGDCYVLFLPTEEQANGLVRAYVHVYRIEAFDAKPVVAPAPRTRIRPLNLGEVE